MELTLEIDEARTLMFEELHEELDEDALQITLERAVRDKLTELYDNRDKLVKSNE